MLMKLGHPWVCTPIIAETTHDGWPLACVLLWTFYYHIDEVELCNRQDLGRPVVMLSVYSAAKFVSKTSRKLRYQVSNI